MDVLKDVDPEIYAAIRGEMDRQQNVLELIASENYTSPAVLEAQGSVLTNKYAEGYPGKRYYGGCEWMDQVETLARQRVLELFGADHANVQPHSGSEANLAVYHAVLNPADTILAMSLAHGGHLTHGMKVHISGRLYHIVSYGVDPKTELIDYGSVRELARQMNPDLIVAGASAYSREIDFSEFADVADELGVPLMVDMAHIAGLVAVGLHNDPVPVADFVTSTTHKTLRGPRSGFILCKKKHAQKIDQAVFPGFQGGPLMHVVAAKAVAFKEALLPEFRVYQEQVVANAKDLAEELSRYGFRIVSGGTDNHLLMVDVSTRGLTGKQAEAALEKAGITVNKNMIPFDRRKPAECSGIRIGTPAVTTRGMKEPEMRQIAAWMNQVLSTPDDASVAQGVLGQVKDLCENFPLATSRDKPGASASG